MATRTAVFKIVAGKNDQGECIFSVVVKRTYGIRNGAAAERAESDRELRMIDAYYEDGDPESCTVQYESELAAFKPAVDVVVIGKAYAPGGQAALKTTVSVKVAGQEKSIAVFGDRKCRFREGRPAVFSDPEPFTAIEIRYERAYGGRDEISDPLTPFLYPRNYLGTGVALRNAKETIEGLSLPNFEDPNDLLTPERVVLGAPENWPKQPLPQGFGWFQRTWYPRCVFAGALPPYVETGTITAEERMGLAPENHIALGKQFRLPGYQPRMQNGASHGMIFPDLKGNERVRLQGLTPDGLLEFALPGETPQVTLDLGSGAQQLQPRLDTVSIRPDEREVDLIWRAPCVYEGYSWLPQMKRLHAEVT